MTPDPQDFDFELDQALASVVGIKAYTPEDAFTARTLGTERSGNGVLIRANGLVLTIGYLVMEAESVWLNLADGSAVQGHVAAFDPVTGFGLVEALARVDLPHLDLGCSSDAQTGEPVILGGAGGRASSVAAQIVAKQEFAGYWEYVLDEAIFTAPAHPNWGGAALIGSSGLLLGIGSLLLQHVQDGGESEDVNMVVPIDILKPILDDLLSSGRASRPPRPWLGVYATEVHDEVVLAAIVDNGPADASDLNVGDLVHAVAGSEVSSLAEFFRAIWALGDAGVEVPLQISRDGETLDVIVASVDRNDLLKSPVMH